MTAATEGIIRDAVEDAEEILDPLEGLIERSAENPGAPFEPEVLERLRELKREDRPAFEALRKRLKKAGVTALDQAIQREGGGLGERPPTHADILIGLAEVVELFRAPDGTGYADVNVSKHRETWPIRSKGFRRWLTRRYFRETQGAPSSEALQSALNVIEARAHFDAPEREVHVRVAGLKGRLYLNLADHQWRAIEIGSSGWRIVAEPPVRFRRARGMLPLPIPKRGGSVQTLRSFLNLRSNHDFVLVVAWALAVLRNCGPYPVMVLAGEQGSAKSTLAAVLKALLDPNSAPLRALPREDRDLFIAATNGHVLAFDNVSCLPSWISDTLCRLATGGGFAVRQLYTDQDEVLFDATRPVILNGIEDVVTRPDLADRAIFLTLEPIPDNQRRPEKEFWDDFENERPEILGGLLDAVVHGLRMLPKTSLKRLPRMADFALWATACETALWGSGAFLAAYGSNLAEAVDTVIDADPVASAVRSLMTERTVWTGTASDLLGALGPEAGETVRKARTWPATPRNLSGRLRRAATFLRKVGIQVSFAKEGRTRTRTITISRVADDAGAQPSASSARSAAQDSSDLGADGRRTNGPGADANPRTADGGADSTVRSDAAETAGADDADDADAKSPNDAGGGRHGAWSARL